jgi:outer membrane lipoprotein-sorting protein
MRKYPTKVRLETWRAWLRRWTAPLAAFVMAMLMTTPEASAKLAPGLELDPEAMAQLRRIEASLNAVRTVHARFRQNSSNGATAAGELFLERPGRLRIDYQPPAQMLIIADGTFLVYYDRKLEQVSHIPLSSTPAGILLDQQLSLQDEQLIVTSFQRSPGVISVEVTRTAEQAEGSILLTFDELTASLRQWAVTDAQGITTLVTLIEPEFNVAIDPSTFEFKDPRISNQFPSRHSP